MKATGLGWLGVAVACMATGSAAAPADKAAAPAPADPASVFHLTFSGTSKKIDPAYKTGSQTLVDGCNLKKPGVAPASDVVTLHLSPAQLGLLPLGAACNTDNGAHGIPSCLVKTKAKQLCSAVKTGGTSVLVEQCVDDDAGTGAQKFGAITTPIAGADYSTPFDIDLRGKFKSATEGAGAKAGKAPWLIKISLDAASMKFFGAKDSADSALAVKQGAADDMFDCMQPIVTDKAGRQSIQLRAKPSDKWGNLNIYVVISDKKKLGTPIVIDPKVPNNG